MTWVSPYRRPQKACGRLSSFRTFYDILGEETTTSQLPSGKERKVVNFLERKLRTTNAKDEESRGKIGAQVVKSREEVEAQVVGSRDEVENQVLKSRKEVEDRA